jgi:selenocysteine lyase/cysteine desulfurase
VRAERGARVRVVRFADSGIVAPEELSRKLGPRARIAAWRAISQVVSSAGTIKKAPTNTRQCGASGKPP